MERKPRKAQTGRLTDWRFFFQIYLVRERIGHLLGFANGLAISSLV